MMTTGEIILDDSKVSNLIENLFNLSMLFDKESVVVCNMDMFGFGSRYVDWGTGRMCIGEELNIGLWNCAHQQDSSNTGKMDVEYAASIEEWILCCLSWLRSNGYGVVSEYWEGKMKEIEKKEKEKESK